MKKRKILWIAAIITAAAVMCAIICFSAQSAAESDQLSKGLAKMLVGMFPALEDVVTVGKLNHYLRKLAHFTLYFILGSALTGAFSVQKKFPPLLAAILLGAMFAATDEIHQIFSENRGPMVRDVLLDACGVIVGGALATLGKWFFRRRRRRLDKRTRFA